MSAVIAPVNGGSRGIGLATATHFVAEGAFVFITARRQAELDAAVSAIGANAFGMRGDVSSPDDLDEIYESIVAIKAGSTCCSPTLALAPSPRSGKSPKNILTTLSIPMHAGCSSPCRRHSR